MKVKFNLPISRHNSKLNFDFNSTFDFGTIQSSLCHFTLPSSKYSINLNQLVRTAPLAVPTFGRMAVHNVFAYVPMSLIYPAFDAFLSQTMVQGTTESYIPHSLPVISNRQLVCMLLSDKKYSHCHTLKTDANNQLTVVDGHRYFNDGRLRKTVIEGIATLPTSSDPFKLVWDYKICDTDGSSKVLSLYKLTNLGRQFYSLFRSLGYSMDYADKSFVSVLPILAYCKAVFDLLYPHRDTPWHSTNIYGFINRYYNGDIRVEDIDGHSFDVFCDNYAITDIDDSYHLFFDAIEPFLIAPVGSDITQVATATPILPTSKAPNLNGFSFDSADSSGISYSIDGNNLIPAVDTSGASADSLRLVDKLWSFVQRSSVVGQDVLDWFKVHFGAKPSEDMFCQSYLLKDVVNLLNVNTVVSTADTSSQNGEVLGGLAGQSYSAESSKISFQAPNFGFLLCLSYVVPVCRPSNGTQPYLYNVGYYDMPFPDFDGLGYESLNSLSFQAYADATGPIGKNTGFGFVPRLTSFKVYNNVTSGGFSLPSLRDNYLPYCLDNFVQLINYPKGFNKDMLRSGIAYATPVNSQTLHWYYPYPDLKKSNDTTAPYNVWRIFDNIFYNNSDYSDVFNLAWSPNNFMCQSSFEVNISSYLKPVSDSFEIDDLFKNVTSVHKS